jgi:hypothetical protein
MSDLLSKTDEHDTGSGALDLRDNQHAMAGCELLAFAKQADVRLLQQVQQAALVRCSRHGWGCLEPLVLSYPASLVDSAGETEWLFLR